jgi:PTH1 family peptidyl-tRNA hydrolase
VKRLVVIGIGNPGRRYERTRHNIGYAIVEALAERGGWEWRPEGERAEAARGRCAGARLLLVKPLTYVNLTGTIMPRLLGELDDPATDLMVVADDLDLPLGRLRMRASGRSGGHRGLDSVIEALGSSRFPRLRVGIGRPQEAEAADYVLGRFAPDEREAARAAVTRAADALECWIERGMDRAMNEYNRDPA